MAPPDPWGFVGTWDCTERGDQEDRKDNQASLVSRGILGSKDALVRRGGRYIHIMDTYIFLTPFSPHQGEKGPYGTKGPKGIKGLSVSSDVQLSVV